MSVFRAKAPEITRCAHNDYRKENRNLRAKRKQMAAAGRRGIRELPAEQHTVSRTVPRLHYQHPENLPTDAGNQYHVSDQGPVSGLQL